LTGTGSPTTSSGPVILAVAAVSAVALVAVYIGFGGGSYAPLRPADPCKPRPIHLANGLAEVTQQIVLSGLDGAACDLGVSREELTLALTSATARTAFARQHMISDATLESAIRKGLDRAAIDAQRDGALTPSETSILRAGITAVPLGTLIDALRSGTGLVTTVGGLIG
jgi:hypothetical protein